MDWRDSLYFSGCIALSEKPAQAPPSGFASYVDRLRATQVPNFLQVRLLAEPVDGENSGFVDANRLRRRLLLAAEGGLPERWSILGAPGSGKTTLVTELMIRLLEGGVACARLVGSERFSELPVDPRALLASLCPAGVDDALWRSRVKRGAMVLFIDGVGETARRLLQPLLRGHHRFPVVVTSRLEHAEDDEDDDGTHELTLAPLAIHDIRYYLEEYGLVGLGALRSARIEGLAYNPQLLALLARERAGDAELPRTRAALLLRQMDSVADVASITDFRVALRFRGRPLPPLAFAIGGPGSLCADWVGMSPDPAEATREVLDKAALHERPDLLFDVLRANRAVLEESLAVTCWCQAGRALVAGPRLRARAIRELMTLPAAMLREALQGGVLDALHDEDPALYHAVRVGLERGALSPRGYQALWAQFAKDPDAEFDLPAAADLLADAIVQLRQAKGSYRRAAANALGHFGAQGAVAALTHVLEPGVEREPKVRGSATNALGQIGDRSAVPALTRALGPEETEPRVRASAATALGNIGDPSAVPALIGALDPACEAEPRVRSSAATALGVIGDMGAVPALAGLLGAGAETDARVRATAANALGRLGDERGVPALVAGLGVEPDPNVRASLVGALGQLRDPVAVGVLGRLLTPGVEPDATVRASAASALAHIRHRSAVPALVGLLDDPDDQDGLVRRAVIHALGQIGDSPDAGDRPGSSVAGLGVAAMIRVLEPGPGAADDPVVRTSSANALGRIGDRAAVPSLSRALARDTDAFVRVSAALALGQIGDRAAVQPLSASLGAPVEDDPAVREAAARALGDIQDRSAVRALIHALGVEGDVAVRKSVVEALGRIGDVGAVPALVSQIDQGDCEARCAVLAALGRLVEGPEPWMLELPGRRLAMNRPGPDERGEQRLRQAGVRLLIRHAHDPQVLQRLRGIACGDPDPLLRALAVRGLAGSGGLDGPTVEYVLDPNCPRKDRHRRDPDPRVRGAVCAAIVDPVSAARNAQTARSLLLVANVLADAATRCSTVQAALEPLSTLPSDSAGRAIRALASALPVEVPNPHLASELRLARECLARRLEADESLRLDGTRRID